MIRQVRIGTRGSQLAVAQTTMMKDELAKRRSGWSFLLERITTKGDLQVTQGFSAIGAKGIFVKELDDALHAKEIDLAVHSLKDVPSTIEKGLVLAAVTRCVDPRDALLSRDQKSLKDLPTGARVGTSSLRRTVLLKKARPDLSVEGLRGNLDTRIRKLDEGQYAAIVLAAAGLKRLGLESRIVELLDVDRFVPTMGQGKLAIVCREDDVEIRSLLSELDDPEDHFLADVERAFMSKMEGGCQVPMGCHAQHESGRVHLKVFVSTPDGKKQLWRESSEHRDRAMQMAASVADEMLGNGGREILAEIRAGEGLLGKRVVITRAVDQSEALRTLLKREGAQAVEVPTIRLEPPADWTPVDNALQGFSTYSVVLFTSANAVDWFHHRIRDLSISMDWGRVVVAAIGPKTGARLWELGIRVDLLPTEAGGAEEFLTALSVKLQVKGSRILLPRAESARELLPEELRKAGATVDVVAVYRTVPAPEGQDALRALMGGAPPDWITFGSGSAVRNFLKLGDETEIRDWIRSHRIRLATIGHVTADEVLRHGLEVAAQPKEPTFEAMIQAMKLQPKGDPA